MEDGRAATCALEQSSILRLARERGVGAYYCVMAVIIPGTWFPLESSFLKPRRDTLVSFLFLGGTFSDIGQDLRVSISISS